MNEMYCAEQIQIPSELGTVLKLLTKASIRDKPQDVYKWGANFFAAQCNRAASFDEAGKLTAAGREATAHSAGFTGAKGKLDDQKYQRGAQQQQQQQQSAEGGAGDASAAGGAAPSAEEEERENAIIDALFDKYDPDRAGVIPMQHLPSLILDLKSELQLDFTHEQMEEFVNSMETDANGGVDLDVFRDAFFHG